MLKVSPDGLMHSNPAPLKFAKSDSASASTLSQFFLLLFSSCIIFVIVLGQLTELKLLMLNKWRRRFHSSRVKLSFVSMFATWFLMSTCLIWIFGSRFILSNAQSSATLWVRDTCLIYGLLSFDDFLDHRFNIFKNVKQSSRVRRLHVWGITIDIG